MVSVVGFCAVGVYGVAGLMLGDERVEVLFGVMLDGIETVCEVVGGVFSAGFPVAEHSFADVEDFAELRAGEVEVFTACAQSRAGDAHAVVYPVAALSVTSNSTSMTGGVLLCGGCQQWVM